MAMEGGDCSFISNDFDFSPEELEVCEILLQLPLLIAKSEFSRGLSASWGCTKKRSALNSSSPSRRLHLSPPLSLLPESGAAAPTPCETKSPSLKKVKASSPTTPLSFLPSESDENTKRSKKKVSLKKKTKWLETINELTTRKQLLEGELETVKRYYDKLKAFNSELRARKQEIILGLKKETVQPENGSSNPATESAQPQPPLKSSALENQQHHHYSSIKDQTAPITEPSQNFQYPFGKMLHSYDNTDPSGIPDLNVSLEELTHRNYSRIMAAQARQRRIQICKIKNSAAGSKMQSPNPCR